MNGKGVAVIKERTLSDLNFVITPTPSGGHLTIKELYESFTYHP
jgi:hypothetical protein